MTQQQKKEKRKSRKKGTGMQGIPENCFSIEVCQGLIKQSNEELGTGKYIYQVKGLLLVPINWDTLIPRKLKMEAWSQDTTKKEEKRKSRKKGNKIMGVAENCSSSVSRIN